jgi:hypothetical protein
MTGDAMNITVSVGNVTVFYNTPKGFYLYTVTINASCCRPTYPSMVSICELFLEVNYIAVILIQRAEIKPLFDLLYIMVLSIHRSLRGGDI